jgi:hypothetical protein
MDCQQDYSEQADHSIQSTGGEMSFDKKDKALVAASGLAGYCQSYPTQFRVMSDPDRAMLERWYEGLNKRTDTLLEALDAVYNDSTDESKE